MTFEERQNVVIVKGGAKELEEYKAKHGLTKGEGVCVIASDLPKEDVMQNGYYKEKIRRLEEERTELTESNAKLEQLLKKAESINNELAVRVAKLEKAFIDAAIR